MGDATACGWERMLAEAIGQAEADPEFRFREIFIYTPFAGAKAVEYWCCQTTPDRADARLLAPLVGGVNAGPVAGKGRGMVLIEEVRIHFDACRVAFLVRRSIPWNHFYNPHAGRFEEVLDAAGEPSMPYVDFPTGPESTPASRRPGPLL